MDNEEYSNKSIICPYCGDERQIDCESDSYSDDDCYTSECDECENTFNVHVDVIHSWMTSQDCELNHKQHNWAKHEYDIGNIPDKTYCECVNCGCTDFINNQEVDYEKT